MINQRVLNRESKRINIIDFIRGLAIINMVLYHLIYDLVYIYGYQIDWYVGTIGYYWQQYICWSFIFVSGISISFSKSNMRRGVKILLMAILITYATKIFTPSMPIKFGILHFIAIGIIITSALENLIKKFKRTESLSKGDKYDDYNKYDKFDTYDNSDNIEWKDTVIIVGLFLLFILTKYFISSPVELLQKFISLEDSINLVNSLRDMKFMFLLGFPNSSFISADYFPILPWIFLMWSGYFSGKLIIKRRDIIKKIDIKRNFICKIGNYSLAIYMWHQIVIMSVLYFIM